MLDMPICLYIYTHNTYTYTYTYIHIRQDTHSRQSSAPQGSMRAMQAMLAEHSILSYTIRS